MNSAKALGNGRSARKNKSGKTAGMGMSLQQAARQIGLNTGDMDGEVERYWDMLTEMAENDPEKYTQFVAKQMEDAREGQRPKRKGFHPKAGFAIESAYAGIGGSKGKTVFINLCGFKGVEMPQDSAGVPVKGDAKVNLSGLNIPLAVAPSREILDSKGNEAACVDAIFNPWVIEQASELSHFKTQVVELALQWCEQELRGKLSRQYRDIASPYKGWTKTAAGDDVTVFFEVGAPEDGNHTKQEEKKEDNQLEKVEMNRPEDLLGAMRQTEESNQDIKIADPLGMLKQHIDKQKAKSGQSGLEPAKRPLIQEIKPKLSKQPKAASTTKSVAATTVSEHSTTISAAASHSDPKSKKSGQNVGKKKKTVVKKGFLDDCDDPGLYGHEGSHEAKPTSLYQRSQIVDLNKMSPEEVQQAVMKHGGGVRVQQQTTPASLQPKPQVQQKVGMEMLQQTMQDLTNKGDQGMKDVFEKLAEAADEEFGAKNIAENAPAVQDQLDGLFGDMAKALGAMHFVGGSDNATGTKENKQTKAQQITDTREDKGEKRRTPEYTIDKSNDKLVLTIALPLVASMADVDVEISERNVRLSVTDRVHQDLDVWLPNKIAKDSARAKFSKKQRKLTIAASTI